MTEIDKKTLSGIIVLTSFLSALGTSVIPPDSTPYYCESRDVVCVGHRLSESGITCYWLVNSTEKGARCTEGWTLYSAGSSELTETVSIYGNGCLHECEYSGSLQSYDVCTCENGQFAYAGELI